MRQLLLIATFLAMFLALPITPMAAQTDARCFPETGFCISGRIRTFWEQNGGLPVFGYPVGPQQEELVENLPFQAQWFERTRLELHPEHTPPYDVLLGRIGADRLAQQGRPDWQAFPHDAQTGDCLRVETGHAVCGAVLTAWRAHGLEFDGRSGTSYAESLALFGLPISSPALEVLEGQIYTVQWFERARFELHPEHAPPYDVLLGLLGNEIRQAAAITSATSGSMAEGMTGVGNRVFFTAYDADHGQELWLTDGTPEGTRLIKDLLPGSLSSMPHWLVDQQSVLLFAAQAIEGSDSLWRSDGTPEGTFELLPATQLRDPTQLTVVGDLTYFVADDSVHGQELWVTDGTSQGTHIVKDIYTGERGIYPEQNMPMGFMPFGLTRVGPRIFFNAESPGQGYGLWVSDGTEAGTQFVSRLGTTDSSPEYWELTALDDATLLFIARTGRLTYGLYRSDGTEAGTRLVYDVSYDRDPGGLRLYPPAGGLHAVSGRVYFFNGATLWQTDGTPEGTAQAGQRGVDAVVEFGGKPYFLAYGQSAGVGLMQTPDGPVIATVAPTLAQANASPEPAAGQLFIAVNSPGGRAELWVSDGTTAGTRPTLALKGLLLRQSDGYSGEHTVTSLGGRLIFLADDGIHGGEPWVSDGTPTGTLMLKDINQ